MPLVLIHGIPTSPALWRHVVPRLANARCLALEMVGYGDSADEGIDQDISVEHQAEYLAAWLREIGVEKAIFAGHDLGGGVAQIAACRHRELCAGLFLTNSICYDSWPIPSVKGLRAMAPVTRRLPDAVAKQILRTLMIRGHDNRQQAREGAAIHWRPYAAHGGAEALVRQMQSLRVEDTLEVIDQLSELNVPARLVWGADDQFQKVGYGERLARDLKASLYRIKRGKHFTPEDHADVVAGELAS